MSDYDKVRRQYKPTNIKILFIAESPPPEAGVQSSRHFYRSEKVRKDDRLFVNTIKALFPDAANLTEALIEPEKEKWLQRFKAAGYYMIEALIQSQAHEVTKEERQKRIKDTLPDLIARVHELAAPETNIILIKSNVFEVAAQPLRAAGFKVLNTELVDYPGRFNQKDYREKLRRLTTAFQS
ncbi:MAG TPA: hypothetical protein VLA88_06245 [Candidatus Saccharimonadales bacterium]|nr:hypothetical protein [Candidatus Saccharimonadales bacterium]